MESQGLPAERLFRHLGSGDREPAPVGGLWYPGPILLADNLSRRGTVVLHIPGSDFVLALAFDSMGHNISNTVSRHMKVT
ncbi:hypothetical protein DL767_009727 [Monosporascus sp. MG133]|nr:hypothetical protein DL767_009727 [Monosporascus sp. MG133]